MNRHTNYQPQPPDVWYPPRRPTQGAVWLLILALAMAVVCVVVALRARELDKGSIPVGRQRVTFVDVDSGSIPGRGK